MFPANAHGGVLVVSQLYHGLNESMPFNMIGAVVKSHFYLIVIRHWSGTLAKNADAVHVAVQYMPDISRAGLNREVVLRQIPHQIVDAR